MDPAPSQHDRACRAIHRILAEINERRDRGDFAGMARLFSRASFRTVYPGVEGGDVGHGTQRGEAEITAGFEAMVRTYGGDPRTAYLTTNTQIEVSPDATTATARSVYLVLQQVPAELDPFGAGFGLQPVSAGRYADRFELVGGEWWIVERVIVADFTGDRSRHMRLDPVDYGRAFVAGTTQPEAEAAEPPGRGGG